MQLELLKSILGNWLFGTLMVSLCVFGREREYFFSVYAMCVILIDFSVSVLSNVGFFFESVHRCLHHLHHKFAPVSKAYVTDLFVKLNQNPFLFD